MERALRTLNGGQLGVGESTRASFSAFELATVAQTIAKRAQVIDSGKTAIGRLLVAKGDWLSFGTVNVSIDGIEGGDLGFVRHVRSTVVYIWKGLFASRKAESEPRHSETSAPKAAEEFV